jgi:DNA-binding transcriptional MocR family regulator
MPNRSTSDEVAGPPAPTTAVAARADRAGRAGLAALLGDWDAGAGPTYRRLARALAGAVERGALGPGARLPSERALAARLAVSRGTVLAAYDTLAGEGLISRRHGSGTFVAAGDGPVPGGLPGDREGSALVHHLADASSPRSAGGLIDLSLSVVHDPGDLDLATLTPARLRAVEPATGYSPWGLAPLRAAIAAHVTSWGLPSEPGQIVVTAGAQQAIAATAACWVRPGDEVVCEDPTYPGALAAFRSAGARVVGVAVDHHGVVLDGLAAAVARRPALVYLQPDVHSPTGVVLAERRRRAVAELVSAARVPLVEDLALSDTASVHPPAPIAAHAPGASIAVVGSLSKTFWGGLRLGFVRAPEPLAQRLVRIKATLDLGTSVPSQLLALDLLTDPGLPAFLRRRRDTLASRARALGAALDDQLPAWRWREPRGGLSLWVRLPGPAGPFVRRARRHGVEVAPPEPLSPSDGHADHIRLSFDAPVPVLEEAVIRLARAWHTGPHQPGGRS